MRETLKVVLRWLKVRANRKNGRFWSSLKLRRPVRKPPKKKKTKS